MPVDGYVTKIESFATKDGGGIRCAVFMAGCPLRCIYCHNPETWEVNTSKVQVFTPEELFLKVKRYKPYFANGGGVTASGGEPLLQAEFLGGFFKLCKADGINTALDTSGTLLDGASKKLIDLTDLLIVDLKFYNEADYKRYANGSLVRVLEFLEYCLREGKEVILRTVIVPGLNDTEEDIKKYADTAKRFAGIRKYELLGFHTMGFSKYEDLGIKNPLEGAQGLSEAKLSALQAYLDSQFS